MNIKQEAAKFAEKSVNTDKVSADEAATHIENLLQELKATERKLAEAEKVLIEIKSELSSMNYRGDLQDLISDYEASKGE